MRFSQRIKSGIKSVLGWLVLLMLAGCNLPVASQATPANYTPTPTIFDLFTVTAPLQTNTPVLIMPTYTLTPIPTRTPTPAPPKRYTTQSGDTLVALAERFGVDAELITSDKPVPAIGFINPGQILLIPDVLGEVGPQDLLLPDAEIVYSPTSINFNLQEYVEQAGGYLSTYTEFIIDHSINGWEVLEREARDNSINPRLLLALLEYESGWVFGQPQNANQRDYPLGWIDSNYKGLDKQLKWVISQLSIGYYGWRSGDYSGLYFPDGAPLRLAPQLNAGSAALQYLFSRRYNYQEWMSILYSDQGVVSRYTEMFGNPWEMSELVGPTFTADTVQPELQLPFRLGRTWAYTGGPHAAWGAGTPYSAIDLAPFMEVLGCEVPNEAVTAVASGMIVRTGEGIVILDLDGDGYEQTGWVILYMHVASQYRVAQGTWVTVDEYIGRPSCEGGKATGTHLHIARKYNGEWVLADGPLPMVLGGWQVQAGSTAYKGYMIKDGQTITAAVNGDRGSHISR